MEAEKRRRANIHVLRSYYGDTENTVQKQHSDPTNIDDPAFDVEEHLSKLLETQSVKGLLKADEETLREIKKLDSDMKTLVYENYNKFISATDTIRKMKSNVENMEEEMGKLAANMEKIEECTNHINNTLAPSREKIRELSGVYRLLKKRQFLFELPSRLKRAQEMGSFNQAVFYYTKTNSVLKKYSDIPSFNTILIECEAIIASLKEALLLRARTQVSLEDTEEAVALLLDLREQPVTLRQEFLSRHGRNLFAILESISERLKMWRKGNNRLSLNLETDEEVKELGPDEALESEEKIMLSFLSQLNTSFLGDYLQFSSAYHRLFITRATTEYATEATVEFEEFTKDLFAKYLLITRAILLKCGRSTQHVISGLGAVQKALGLVHRQSLIANHLISGMAADVINRTVNKLIDRHFKQMQNDVDRHVMKVIDIAQESSQKATQAKTGEPATLAEACNLLGNAIISEVEQFLDSLKLLFVVTPGTRFLGDHGAIFVAKVAVKVQSLFLGLTIRLADFFDEIGDTNPHSSSPLPALLLARTCHHLEAWGIPHVHTLLRDLAAMSPHSASAELSISLPDIIEKLHQSSGKLQAFYVKRQGQRLSEMIHLGILTTPWLRLPEPRDVRLATEMVVDELIAMRQEIGRVFPPRDREREMDRRGTDAAGRGRYKDASRGGLFDKKLVIFGGVAGDADSIHMAIVRVCLKAFVESIRMQTFSRNAHHQIQVDAHFISVVLRPFARLDEDQFDRFLEDILASALDRCLDGAPLDASIVASICQPKLAQRAATM